MEWSTLPHQLDTGTYESKALLNPYTNDIYIIGGYSRDAIDAEIFDQITSNCRLALIGNQNLAVRMPFCTVFEMIVMLCGRVRLPGVQGPSLRSWIWVSFNTTKAYALRICFVYSPSA